MLLDEPFGALDAWTRIEAQRLVESLWTERRFTAVLVTHDVEEAVLLGDRVLLVDDGCLVARYDVDVPRPRRRGDPDIARITARVLDRIFDATDEVLRKRLRLEPTGSTRDVSSTSEIATPRVARR